MDVSIDVVLSDAGKHMFLVQSDSPEFVQGIFKSWYGAGGVECDVLPAGDRRTFLYQLELFDASTRGRTGRNFFKSDRHVQSRFGM